MLDGGNRPMIRIRKDGQKEVHIGGRLLDDFNRLHRDQFRKTNKSTTGLTSTIFWRLPMIEESF